MAITTSEASAAVAARPPPRRQSLLLRVSAHWADYLYVLPPLGVMALVIAYPIYYTIYPSFFKTSPSLAMEDITFIGFDNYVAVLRSQSFRDVTANTVIWTVFSTAIAFVLGFGAALALNGEFLGRGVLRALLLIPYVISAVAASYVWRWIYHSDFGVIGALATSLGLSDGPVNLLDNTISIRRTGTSPWYSRTTRSIRTKPSTRISPSR